MITKRKLTGALSLILIGVSMVLGPAASAYMQRLRSEELQEAFSLGRSTDPETVSRFFQKYSRQFDCRGSDPCIDSIELRTPFEEVAVQSRKRNSNYTEQDAEKDYRVHPTELSVHVFVLRLLDSSTDDSDPSNEGMQSDGDSGYSFYGYLIRVSQSHVLKPESIRSKSVYSGGSHCQYCGGEEIILDFDPAQFDSAVTRIDVITPNGQTVKASFDLRGLK